MNLRQLFLLLPLHCAYAVMLFNAALHKNCTQSSDYDAVKVAGNAVDGVVSNYMNTCASTAHYDRTPWWRVDLEHNYVVYSVMVRNRNRYEYRLHDFTVWVSTDGVSNGAVCATRVGEVGVGAVETLTCDPIGYGRYVKITKPSERFDDILTLCEVQVLVVRTRLIFERQIQKAINGEVQTGTSAPDAPSCAKLCYHDQSCSAFGFHPATDTCQLYSSTRKTAANNDGWRFYVMI